jgi:hypothetical protein
MIITTNNIITYRKYASVNYKVHACILHASVDSLIHKYSSIRSPATPYASMRIAVEYFL